MKRDMDLVRQMLIRMEDGVFLHGHKNGLDMYCQDKINGHLSIMSDGDLIRQTYMHLVKLDDGSTTTYPGYGLTWKGHDFLDAVRDDAWWQKVKDRTKEVTGGLGIEMLKEAALDLFRQGA